MGGAYFLLLSSLGFAVTVQGQECAAPVGNDMSLKDEYITLTEFPDGITVYFACNIGYEAAGGSAKITCAKGVWSTLSLRCQKKSCGTPGEVVNGAINFDEGIDFGAIAVVTCNPGYQLVGDKELICGDQGWLNRLPTCEVLKCDPPPKISNGSFNPVKESYEHSEVVMYTCIADNTLNGSKVLSCSDGGEFKPAPPKCVYVECPEPVIKYAKWKDGSRPPYKFKSSVTYECQNGYRLKGHDTVTCDINGQWLPGLPECIRIEVTTKATTTTSTTTTTTPAGETPDSYTPSSTPDNRGSDLSNVGYSLLGVGIVCAIGGGLYAYYRQKKRKQISHDDKEAANNGEQELCHLNDTTTTDVKKDETQDTRSTP